jgi:hypothetical protein
MTTCDKPEETPAIVRSRSWDAVQRLGAEFPSVSSQNLVRILVDSRRAVDLFGLPDEQELAMAEKIAAERLRQILGESTAKATARLDPEKHQRRGSAAPRVSGG